MGNSSCQPPTLPEAKCSFIARPSPRSPGQICLSLPWFPGPRCLSLPRSPGPGCRTVPPIPGAALPESLPDPRGLSNSLLLPPVSVTLDVETADSRLQVSGDRKSVRFTGTQTNLPDTGKRFTFCECVLGSEGFTSGRHYWEVEVTGNRRWCLGVAAESVERKGQVNPSPETGFWIIKRYYEEIQNYGVASQNYGMASQNYGRVSQNYGVASQNYGVASQNYGVASQNCDVFSIHTSPESRLPASSIPGRLGVYLSYESGKVSFYNAETKSHIHTFTGNKFTEKLYPFFRTWDVNQWLRICSGSAPGL
ncbi:E3 ubiquitin-protein ligase TRIM39-like [Mobula hypostoma]|uniref:E3 ubiquitin-protein ligase TRIM39-like n=1 Tax=Mobula hypostoma TaxID=723540 RepID=UPI002FC35726